MPLAVSVIDEMQKEAATASIVNAAANGPVSGMPVAVAAVKLRPA